MFPIAKPHRSLAIAVLAAVTLLPLRAAIAEADRR